MKKIIIIPQAFALLITVTLAQAGSATWNLNPTSSDWNTATNWTPATVPNSPTETATFGVSNTTDISLSAAIKLDSILFDSGASTFTISTGVGSSFTIGGAGILNNSGLTQSFLLPVDAAGGIGFINFINTASAGTGTVFTVDGSISSGSRSALLFFLDRSTAGDATFLIGGGAGSGTNGGLVAFSSDSSAGNATFICEPSAVGAGTGGIVGFSDTSNAGSATITVNGPAVTNGVAGQATFASAATAANATLIARGTRSGVTNAGIYFSNEATGGRARVEVFGTGFLAAGGLTVPSLTIGSIEGNGSVSLGSTDLFVGGNNLSTTFSGVISGDGSLTKLGERNLVLSGASSYTGGTHIQRGNLLVKNTADSATGTGSVQVDGGALEGTGIISGGVIIGTGSGHKAVLRPGQAGATSALLSIQKSLTFNSDARCQLALNSDNGTAAGVAAKGVTISGASVFISDAGNVSLQSGTVFIVLNNTAATPVAGTFSNLADGGTITVANNTFQANYEGGDGNDLTLTVQ